MTEWQPIETLSERTEALLVGYSQGNPHAQTMLLGYWRKGGRKHRSKRIWVAPGLERQFVFTHWMELPEFPATPEIEADYAKYEATGEWW